MLWAVGFCYSSSDEKNCSLLPQVSIHPSDHLSDFVTFSFHPKQSKLKPITTKLTLNVIFHYPLQKKISIVRTSIPVLTQYWCKREKHKSVQSPPLTRHIGIHKTFLYYIKELLHWHNSYYLSWLANFILSFFSFHTQIPNN